MDTQTTVVAEGTFNTQPSQSTGAPATETKQVSAEETKAQTEAERSEAPKDDRFSAKFAALTRKEKEIKAREKAALAREAELQKRLQEVEERSKSERTLEDMLKENPLKVLKEKLGYDFEKLAEIQLNDENPTTDMKIQRALEKVSQTYEEKIKKLEERLEEQTKLKAEEEKQEAQKQYEQTVNGFKTQIKDLVAKDDEKFELVQSRGQEGIDMVFEVMQNVYLETSGKDEDGNILLDETGMPVQPGKIMDIAEAIAEVERELEEHAKKILELKKFKKQTSQEKEASTKQDSPTLSNTHSSEVPRNGMKRLSDEESKREAAKLIRWQD